LESTLKAEITLPGARNVLQDTSLLRRAPPDGMLQHAPRVRLASKAPLWTAPLCAPLAPRASIPRPVAHVWAVGKAAISSSLHLLLTKRSLAPATTVRLASTPRQWMLLHVALVQPENTCPGQARKDRARGVHEAPFLQLRGAPRARHALRGRMQGSSSPPASHVKQDFILARWPKHARNAVQVHIVPAAPAFAQFVQRANFLPPMQMSAVSAARGVILPCTPRCAMRAPVECTVLQGRVSAPCKHLAA